MIIPLAVYNFFVFTGMAFINTKFFDLSSTYAMSGGALIVLVGVVVCGAYRDEGVAPTNTQSFVFVGAPPSGRWVVVCEAFRDEGVAPTNTQSFAFVGAPPSGRWVVVCEAFRDEGVAPTNTQSFVFVGAPPSGRWVVVC